MAAITFLRWDSYSRTRHTNRMRSPTPRWLSCWDQPPSGSMLWNWMDASAGYYGVAERTIDTVRRNKFLESADLSSPRLAWRCTSPIPANEQLIGVSGYTSGWFTIRQADDALDFVTSFDPVYVVDNSKMMYFRNLAITEFPIHNWKAPTYTLSGTTTGIINDSEIALVASGTSGPVYPVNINYSDNINYDKCTVELPLTGNVVLRYQGLSHSAAVTGVWVNSHAPVVVEQFDLWNVFDSFGLLLGLSRVSGETNRDYKDRLINIFQAPPGVTKRGILFGMGRELQLAGSLDWDGVSTVTFATSGVTGVTHVYVDNLPQTGSVRMEALTPASGNSWSANNTYYSLHEEWLPGWKVFLDGRLITTESHSGMTQSGNTLRILCGAVSGDVRASYQYANYTTTKDASGYILTVSPVSVSYGNTQASYSWSVGKSDYISGSCILSGVITITGTDGADDAILDTGETTGWVATPVLDTAMSGALFDSITWTFTTTGSYAGYVRTLDYRASDTTFVPSDTSPSWVGASHYPYTTGVDPGITGRYVQVRMWLTPSGTTSPKLDSLTIGCLENVDMAHNYTRVANISGDYHLSYVRLLDLWAPTSKYAENVLLDSIDMPTQEFRDLSDAISAAIPIQYGSAFWSKRTHWFDAGEVLPQVGHLPIIYDCKEY